MDKQQIDEPRLGDAERPREAGEASPGRGGRASRQRKMTAVLRLLRGEDLEIVSRSLGVTAATLTNWRDAFLSAGEVALTTKPATGEELESDRLKAKLGAALIERDLLNEKDRHSGGQSPFGPTEVQAMSRVTSPVTGKCYGLATVCRLWRLARSGVYRHRASPPETPPRRRGPIGAMADEALTAAIRAVLAASPFHGEGHRKVWARLRHVGTRTSLRRVLRLMRENDLLAPTRAGSARGPRTHDGTIIPETVDTMWGTDLTATFTGEGQAAVFIAVDHCSAECVGIHAHARATRFEALEPIRQGVQHHFGGFAAGVARGLKLRHDHGSQYMADHFQKEIAFLGIESSPAFVRAPEGNGCAERFIRTLKENLLWVRTFDTIEDLRQALLAFRETYNTTWLIERHGFITPADFRRQQLQPIAKAA
jgi:putative transposase